MEEKCLMKERQLMELNEKNIGQAKLCKKEGKDFLILSYKEEDFQIDISNKDQKDLKETFFGLIHIALKDKVFFHFNPSPNPDDSLLNEISKSYIDILNNDLNAIYNDYKTVFKE